MLCFNCKKKGKDNDKKSLLFSAASNSDLNASVWCIDSGTSSRLCCNLNMFDEFKQHSETIILAGMLTERIGTVRLTINKNIITLVDVSLVSGV